MFDGQLETATASSRPHERAEEHEPPVEMPLLGGLPFMFRGDFPQLPAGQGDAHSAIRSSSTCAAIGRRAEGTHHGACTPPSRSRKGVVTKPFRVDEFLAYPSEGLVPGLLDGRATFWPEGDRGDRLRLMYFIHCTLADLFVDPANEGRWMRAKLADLDDLSPLEYMLQKRIPGMVALCAFVEQRLANR